MLHYVSKIIAKLLASAGNRTRAARVAGEHSTTEPPMQTLKFISNVEVNWPVCDVETYFPASASAYYPYDTSP